MTTYPTSTIFSAADQAIYYEGEVAKYAEDVRTFQRYLYNAQVALCTAEKELEMWKNVAEQETNDSHTTM
jgi:hypothetical protein